MNKAEINIERKFEILIKILLTFSCAVLTIILSNRYELLYTLIGALLSFIAMIVIVKRISINKINVKKFIISAFISCYMMRFFLEFSAGRILNISNYINRIINYDFVYNFVYAMFGMLALPTVVLFVYIFICKIVPKIISFFRNFTIVEKRYFIIMILVGIFVSVIITNMTTAFSRPTLNGIVKNYDVIYTTDSGDLMYDDAYFNVSYEESDIRQPLFGVFSLPFAVLAKMFSHFIFLVPKDYSYEVALTIIQFILTTISTIMLARLLKIEEKDKKFIYLLFSLSYPYLLFNIVIEQYVIGLFYLILTFYLFYQYDGINYAYIGATGTIITSGILLPIITKFKNLKQYLTDIFKCFIAFISVFIISGQFPQILLFKDKLISLLNGFAVGKTFNEKLFQFFNFVKSIFFSAKGEIVSYSYQLSIVENLSVIGIILFAIIIISAIMNRKEKMARISFLWVCFSIIILLIIGWGTIENGLILYSLYFAWAYLILFYLFFRKIFKNRKIFITTLTSIIIIMTVFNFRELYNILEFAISYY